MVSKDFFREIFYYFGSHSEYDETKQCFNDIYELYGIKFIINEIAYSNQGFVIPYEGIIPPQVFKCLDKYKNIYFKINSFGKEIFTEPLSFIKFITELNNHYNSSNKKCNYKDIYSYCNKKYLGNNLLSEYIDLNYLANASNSYYRKCIDGHIDNTDLAINKILQCIDDNTSIDKQELIYEHSTCYESVFNENTGTRYVEFKLGPGYSIMHRYEMKHNDIIDDINKLCECLSLDKYSIEEDLVMSVEHSCIAKYCDIYDEDDFRNNKANNLTISFGKKKKENGCTSFLINTQVFSYNLNSHEIIRFSNGSNKNRNVTDEEKKAIYSFLCKVNEKINIDLKTKHYQKELKK